MERGGGQGRCQTVVEKTTVVIGAPTNGAVEEDVVVEIAVAGGWRLERQRRVVEVL